MVSPTTPNQRQRQEGLPFAKPTKDVAAGFPPHHRSTDHRMVLEEIISFKGYLRPTKDNFLLGIDLLQRIDQLESRHSVPQVNRKTDHISIPGSNLCQKILFRLIHRIFTDQNFTALFTAISRKARQCQTGVNIFTVEGGQQSSHGMENSLFKFDIQADV